jgi:hypothetical protein
VPIPGMVTRYLLLVGSLTCTVTLWLIVSSTTVREGFDHVKDGWIIVAFLVIWVVGMRFVLPKMGIPT